MATGWSCDKCEGAADDLSLAYDGSTLCEYCYADYAFKEEHGELFSWGAGAFVGFDTGRTWNGWAIPQFTSAEIHNVLRFMRLEFDSINNVTSDGTTISYDDLNAGERFTLTPNVNGLYEFDGWIWDKIEIVGDENSNIAFDAIDARLRVLGDYANLDWFRDELLDAWALEVQFIGEERALQTWRTLGWFLTRY